MAFGSLVPGMAPMSIPQMQPNQMMKMGMQAMQMGRGRPQAPAGPGQPMDLSAPQQGILQRLLNPAAPPAAGMPADPSQMGMLAKLFPALQSGGMAPGGAMPMVPPNALGGLY